jgi:methyl-accepting chemotaxis protein
VSLDSIHTLSTDNLSEMATTTDGIESLRETAEALELQVERFRLDAPVVQVNAVVRTGKRVGTRLQVA